jgi:tetratricopeptide (TPR) repeat protein
MRRTITSGAYFDKKDYDRAIKDYDEAIRLDGKDATDYLNRGAAYDNKGDLDRALRDYSAAIRLRPRYAVAHHYRGRVHARKGNHEQALADFMAAIRANRQLTRDVLGDILDRGARILSRPGTSPAQDNADCYAWYRAALKALNGLPDQPAEVTKAIRDSLAAADRRPEMKERVAILSAALKKLRAGSRSG